MSYSNNKPLLSVAIVLFSFLGFVLSEVVKTIASELLVTGGAIIGLLLIPLPWIIFVLITYYGIDWVASVGEKTRITSITFVLFWVMSSIGLVFGTIVLAAMDLVSTTISLNTLVSGIFINLPFAMIPALAGALSLSNKPL
ncbi:MAG: hypothetical protein ACXAEU_17720 [Candidatus Hodarchaeales archaeon]